jgi:hypothetical protein
MSWPSMTWRTDKVSSSSLVRGDKHRHPEIIILSLTRGLRDLQDGFWIWWSNLLGPYTTGYSSSQITNWHTVSSSNGHSLSIWTTILHIPGLFWLLYIASSGPHGKYYFQQYPAGLLLRCLAMDGTLILRARMSRACLPSRCLEMCLCVTIYYIAPFRLRFITT